MLKSGFRRLIFLKRNSSLQESFFGGKYRNIIEFMTRYS